MYQQKKPRNYKSLWLLSLSLIAIGIVLTINLAMIRPVGFVLLGIGGFGMIWSLSNKKGWDDREDPNEPKQFN
ncbi:MAG: hypothetical protein GY790_03080 [Bacteroidetes bacterium]|nr:hypothetical protein [Bacteroidota bacterium]